MPRENRKRGKKHKKTRDETQSQHAENQYSEEQRAGPSWIVPTPDVTNHADSEAPFGYVEAEVKAYFRTVDLQIRDWQNEREDQVQAVDDVDPNEGTSWNRALICQCS